MINKEEIKKMQEYAEYLEKRKKEIQSLFDFKIESYIIEEIVYRENSVINDNIIALIRLAQSNNRLTEEQAEILIKSIDIAKNYKR